MIISKQYIALFLMVWNAITFSQTNIPFQLAGKLIIVKATVDGQPGNFILDTGTPSLVLNIRYFEGDLTEKFFHGLNGQVGKLAVSYPSVRIDDQHWDKVYAEVIPMLALESAKGVPIHGLLGTELFRNYTLLIDFQHLELTLYFLDGKGENPAFTHTGLPTEIVPFRFKGGTPLVSLPIGKQVLKLAVDTGAEINLLADKYLDELAPFIGKRRQQRFCGFGQEAQDVTSTIISGLRIGTISIEEMTTAFGNLSHYNRHVSGPVADGIVGYEFLSQFRVGFNFKERELYLWEMGSGLMVSKSK